MKKRNLLYFINTILSMFCLVILFITANLSLGTKQHHEQIIANYVIKYFFGRLIINATISIVFAFAIYLSNTLLTNLLNLKNFSTYEIVKAQLFISLLASICFILLGIYKS